MIMKAETLRAHLALTMVQQLGDVHIAQLLKCFGTPEAIFKANHRQLEAVPGIGEVRAKHIKGFREHAKVDREINHMLKWNIKVLVRGEEGYPNRLLHCLDAPHLLYYKGIGNLVQEKIISIVGTRSPTEYGRERVVELLSVLRTFPVLVVSGLAYGIDTLVHRECLKEGIQTLGVLGHGLDKIYPFANRQLASDMQLHGGLMSEFRCGTKPDRQNFPRRNRIVSGMADAVVVVESGIKGGSLITADIANSYNRDVLAYPGRATDIQSKGCNELIRMNKANLVTNGQELVEFLNWVPVRKKDPVQSSLFVALDGDEKHIYEAIGKNGQSHIDELAASTGIKPSMVSAVLFELEMKGLVVPLPGKLYTLAGR